MDVKSSPLTDRCEELGLVPSGWWRSIPSAEEELVLDALLNVELSLLNLVL